MIFFYHKSLTMEPQYTWARIGKHDAKEAPDLDWYLQRKAKPHILDIMGAPIQGFGGNGQTKKWIEEGTTMKEHRDSDYYRTVRQLKSFLKKHGQSFPKICYGLVEIDGQYY